MSDPLILQVTNAGRAALVAAQAAGTNQVLISQVGLSASGAVVASPTAVNLPGEHRRVNTVRGAAISADTIHMIVEDASAAVYDVRAFALYLADGTLFAIYGQPGLILSKAAPAIFLLAIDVKFEDIDAANITFGDANFLNPPATEATAGVMEVATNAEALAGTDDARAITPLKLKYVFDNKLGAWVLKSGDTMTGTLIVNKTADDAAIVIAGNTNSPFLAGYSKTLSTRYGYLQFTSSGIFAVSEAGPFSIQTGGATRLSISVAGTATFSNVGVFNASGYGVMANDGSGADARVACSLSNSPLAFMQAMPGIARFGAVGSNEVRFATNGADRVTIDSAGAARFSNSLTVAGITYFGTADGLFYAARSGLDPIIHLDNNDFFQYVRGSNSGLFYVNSIAVLTFTAAGVSVAGAFSVSGVSSLAGGASFGDSNFALGLPGGNPVITVDVGGDYFQFDRAANQFNFVIGGVTRLFTNAGGGGVAGSFQVSGPITQGGNQVWHVGNDGSGSGLDADLLDGYQAGAFALRNQDVVFRDVRADRGDGTGVVYLAAAGTRYLYFDGASYVMPNSPLYVNGGLVWTSANDGSGSGLDADLLDGMHASQFWRPDNDGPGSGLDADTLDGLQAAAFARIVASSNFSAGGYRVWSDGFKEMWGSGTVGGSTSSFVFYPISFDSWSRAFVEGGAALANAQDNNPFVSSTNINGFSVFNAHNGSLGLSWFACGY